MYLSFLYKTRLWYIFLLVFFAAASVKAQQISPFKNGDRVVFMGNSITDGGHYHAYIWLYYMTHFPGMRLWIFNAGIGGDVARQMLERIDSEVFAKKPTVMTLTFGMNDTGYQNLAPAQADSVYRVKVAVCLKYFRLITDTLKLHPEIKKIMIASSPYDETAKIKTTPLLKKNSALLSIAAEQHKTAAENNWGFVDFNTPMTAINQQEQQRDSSFTMEGTDRIHPTNDGQMVMAYIFLNAQGLSGKKVADIEINTSWRKVEKAENCTVSAFSGNKNDLKFIYLANSLPYPLDTIPGGFGRPGKSQAEALKLIPFTADYNQELLAIKGLKPDGRYALRIDDKPIGQWTGNEYAAGINLALITGTPQYQQALAVMHLNEERWGIERRLREYYWIQYSILKPKGLLFNDSESTVDSLQKYAKKDFFVAVTMPTYQKARFKNIRDAWQKEMDLLVDEIYHINKPVAHRFEITLSN
jgi:lysophospholipase L1-like esterase